MSSNCQRRFACHFSGCNKSYIRSEHLNRHRLKHQQRAFACCFCKKLFTRNDLLQVHLRRHEIRSFENTEGQREPTPPHQGHRDDLLRKTNPTSAALSTSTDPSQASIGLVRPVIGGLIATTQAEIHRANTLQPTLELGSFWPDNLSNFHAPDYLTYNVVFDQHGVQVRDTSDREKALSHAEYQILITEYPNLQSVDTCNKTSLLKFINHGMDYLEALIPCLHHSTFAISTVPILSLALCSLGMALSAIPEVERIGQMLYTDVSKRLIVNTIESHHMEVPILQAMLLTEHIGYYTSTRHDHQKAEIMHAMLVTFCRQSSLLVQNAIEFSILQEDPEEKWKTWVKHETSVRLAYGLFVSDIGHAILCMKPSLLSTEMLNLPLPCGENLWQAKTANEWAALILRNQMQRPKTLQALLKVVFPENNAKPTHDITFYSFPSGPDIFTMQIIIHAIASAVLDHQHRSIHCLSSHAISLLKMEDFKMALERWHHHFGQIHTAKQKTQMGASALVTYHFTWILLYDDLSSIQLVASSTLAVGSSLDSQVTRDASTSLLISREISNPSFLHALEIIDICLGNQTEESIPAPLDKQHDINPLYQNYTAFLGVMVAWTNTLRRSLRGASGITLTSRPSVPSFFNQLENDRLLLHPTLQINKGRNEEALPLIWKSESGRIKVNMQDLNATKDDVSRLMEIVKERLARS
ncbi:hypothetical protein N431DRAFT_438346 [Stipitochalara longipes BDJ]|nr:hypothetical protein N431DRAFT_438346 [Stipitochalara longipes BDJ]